MELRIAMKILDSVMCECLGYAKDLSFNPTQREIGDAIQTLEEALEKIGGVEQLAVLASQKRKHDPAEWKQPGSEE